MIRYLCIAETDTKMSRVNFPLRRVSSKKLSYSNSWVTRLKMRIEDIPGPNNTPASARAIQSRSSSDFSSTSVTLGWLSKWNWSLLLLSTKLKKTHRTKTYPNKHSGCWGNKRKDGPLHVPLFLAGWSKIHIESFKSAVEGGAWFEMEVLYKAVKEVVTPPCILCTQAWKHTMRSTAQISERAFYSPLSHRKYPFGCHSSKTAVTKDW